MVMFANEYLDVIDKSFESFSRMTKMGFRHSKFHIFLMALVEAEVILAK